MKSFRLPPDVARKFKLLKLSVDIPAPRDPAAQAELAKIAVSLDGDYGKGNVVPGRQERKIARNCRTSKKSWPPAAIRKNF